MVAVGGVGVASGETLAAGGLVVGLPSEPGSRASMWSATPTTMQGPLEPGVLDQVLGDPDPPRPSRASRREPAVEASLHHPALAAERVEVGEERPLQSS